LRSPLKANLKKTLQIREIAFFLTGGYMVESGNFYNGRFLSTSLSFKKKFTKQPQFFSITPALNITIHVQKICQGAL